MSNFTDVFFFIGFIGILAIFAYKLFNLFSSLKLYDIKGVFLTFIAALVFWFLALASFLTNVEETLYMVFFRFANLLLILTVMFTIVELLVNLGKIGTDPKRAAKFSNKEEV